MAGRRWTVGFLLHAAAALVVISGGEALAQGGNNNSLPANTAGSCTPGACYEPYFNVLFGYGSTTTNFQVVPSFDVNAGGPFVELGAGLRIPVPGTQFTAGGRVTGIFSNAKGQTFYAPTGFEYSVRQQAAALVEVEVGINLEPVVNLHNIRFHRARTGFNVYAFGGFGGMIYNVRALDPARAYDFNASSPAFTGGVRVEVPFQPVFTVGPGTLVGQFRYINFGNTTVSVPGPVDIKSEAIQGSIGFTVPLMGGR